MMHLYLVRHGEAAAGLAELDPGLSDIGRTQAAAAAGALAGSGAKRLIVSPLNRTRETAQPIAEALGLEPVITPSVGEVFDPETPVEERQAMIGPFMRGRWSEQNERLAAWRERLHATLLELAAGTGDAVIVSHYIAIGATIGRLTDDDRVVPLPIMNASITTIEVEDGAMRLVEAASTSHLGEGLVTGAGFALPGQ